MIIGISDELQYLDISNIVKNYFKVHNYGEDLGYCFLWDLYCVFRIIKELENIYLSGFSEDLYKISQIFSHVKFDNERFALSSFLNAIKNYDLSFEIDGNLFFS